MSQGKTRLHVPPQTVLSTIPKAALIQLAFRLPIMAPRRHFYQCAELAPRQPAVDRAAGAIRRGNRLRQQSPLWTIDSCISTIRTGSRLHSFLAQGLFSFGQRPFRVRSLSFQSLTEVCDERTRLAGVVLTSSSMSSINDLKSATIFLSQPGS
jgi:hypothetical protein